MLWLPVVEDRPWIAAFERLMRERPGLHKQDLAAFGKFAPPRISTLLKGPKQPEDPTKERKTWSMPDVETLQMFADAFTNYDRRERKEGGDPTAPAVELWEFFVSDTQVALLRSNAANQRELLKPVDTKDAARAKIVAEVIEFMETREREAEGQQKTPDKRKHG